MSKSFNKKSGFKPDGTTPLFQPSYDVYNQLSSSNNIHYSGYSNYIGETNFKIVPGIFIVITCTILLICAVAMYVYFNSPSTNKTLFVTISDPNDSISIPTESTIYETVLPYDVQFNNTLDTLSGSEDEDDGYEDNDDDIDDDVGDAIEETISKDEYVGKPLIEHESHVNADNSNTPIKK